MANERPYCECAFCTSIETLAHELALEKAQEGKHPCMRCGREWTNPEHCYCGVLEEELAY
ncbi:MAG TPA: hypothetical protein VJ579_00570 [Candidatus Paceibacterota bacterium]|nr:hypothetical protein [Candidatus Paceibacterota bacterium]